MAAFGSSGEPELEALFSKVAWYQKPSFAEFLANEVPGVSVPDSVLARMRKATEHGKEAALAEGVKIAREMFALVKKDVQGIQVSAPFGRVEVALEVFK